MILLKPSKSKNWIIYFFTAFLIVTVIAATPFSTHAAECDCRPNDCAELTDIKDFINGLLHFWVTQGLVIYPQNPGVLVRKVLGPGLFFTWIETALDDFPDHMRKRKNKEDTKYKDADRSDGRIWLVGNAAINPCIKLCGVCVGTDKLGHFFQQGWEYDEYVLQGGDLLAEEKSVRSENEWWGMKSTGVKSNADLEANRKGGRFYKAVRLRTPPFPTFDICNFVNQNWSEEVKRNEYSDSLRVKVEAAGGN